MLCVWFIKKRFFGFLSGFSNWISYPLIVLKPLAHPYQKKPRFFSFPIFLVEVHVEYRTRSSKKSFQFIVSDLTTLKIRRNSNFKGWKLKKILKNHLIVGQRLIQVFLILVKVVRFYSRKSLKVTLLSCVGKSLPQTQFSDFFFAVFFSWDFDTTCCRK